MKKKLLAIIMALVMGVSVGALASCDIVTTDSEKDMAQTVAEVNISKSEDFAEDGAFYAYKDVIRPMSVSKRELVAYFVNSGYSYISQGYTYTKTFDLLVDSMVNYKIIIQYAMAYFFENASGYYTPDAYKTAVGDASGEELSLKTLVFFLDNAADEENRLSYTDSNGVKQYYKDRENNYYTRYDQAVYALKKSINTAIDTQEAKYISASSPSSSSDSDGEDRATPNGVNTEKEDYFDPSYAIWTGSNSSAECGSYKKQDGSTAETRKKGYNAFVNMLASNYLISDDELPKAAKGELESLGYYRSELITQLESALSEKLNDHYETQAKSSITGKYLAERFNGLFSTQKALYDNDISSFESGLGSVSDSSFVLYCPEGATAQDATKYGFVYNILLPFSASQSYALKQYQSDDGLSEAELYGKRQGLLEKIQATDQRESWFNGATDYSFKASERGITDYYDNGNVGTDPYLFFEESMTKSSGEGAQYDKIQKYLGLYPYNGEVSYNAKKEEYKLTPNKLSVTEFLTEMESYLGYALGRGAAGGLSGTVSYNGNDITATDGMVSSYMQKPILNADHEVDYSNFLYYIGKVDGLDGNANNLFVEGTDTYKAMCAFNELQFAYSTDPGALNTYLGYSVSRYKTSFVGEFEYAAKVAISQGVGTYTVCPSDFGWHVIYCTYAFDEGAVYSIGWTTGDTAVVNEDNLTKNSFEYYFYQAIKDSLIGSYVNVLESKTTNLYNTDTCVKVYKNRYSDYTDLDKSQTNTSTSSSSSGRNQAKNP